MNSFLAAYAISPCNPHVLRALAILTYLLGPPGSGGDNGVDEATQRRHAAIAYLNSVSDLIFIKFTELSL